MEQPFFVSLDAVRNLKDAAASRISGVSSSHMSEAIAVALGFKTHASLRAALDGNRTVRVSLPDNERFVARLRSLGYSATLDNAAVLPDLAKSYYVFAPPKPVLRPRSPRWNAWRNLMVAAINAGLDQRRFGLSEGEDWWTRPRENSDAGSYRFDFADLGPALVTVRAISGGELSFSVALAPVAGIEDARLLLDLKQCDAHAQGWLERKLGVWIHEGGHDFRCKRAVLGQVAAAKVETAGYADLGSFIP